MARACKETPSGPPLLVHLSRTGGFKNEHHRKAVQHYNKAIVKARRVLRTGGSEKQIMVTLISGILFHIFEWFHGNPSVVDQVIPLLMGLLREQAWVQSDPAFQRVIRGALCMSSNSNVFQSIAPHFPTIQRHIWGQPEVISFHLPAAPGPERGFEEFLAVWWRFLTSVINLYVQPFYLSRAAPAQSSSLLAVATSWQREAVIRASASDASLRKRLLLAMATIANQVSKRVTACFLSPLTKGPRRGDFVALSKHEYASIVEFYKLARMQPSADYEYDLITEALNHPALPTLVYVGRHCPHQALRLEALELCRPLLQPVASATIKATYMALRALAEVEGEALANRYLWTESSWNDDYTALNITLAPVDPVVDHELPVKHMVLSVSEYGV